MKEDALLVAAVKVKEAVAVQSEEARAVAIVKVSMVEMGPVVEH